MVGLGDGRYVTITIGIASQSLEPKMTKQKSCLMISLTECTYVI